MSKFNNIKKEKVEDIFEVNEPVVEEVNDPVVEEVEEVIEKVELPTYIVDVEKLNVRASASTNADIVTVLNKGDKISGSKEGEWIKLDNNNGFVMAKFVK